MSALGWRDSLTAVDRIDDRATVAAEYAREDGLLARRSVYEHSEGIDPRSVAWDAIAEREPRRVLEVGCGPGELSERIAQELRATVVAVDISERMVALARQRGVDARVGDVQSLALPAATFDLAVAAWMLYHVPDLDRGLAELARVLQPSGCLVAVTNSEHHLDEIRRLAGFTMPERLPFSRENGAAILRRHFGSVEQRDIDGEVAFADAHAVRDYFRSTVTSRVAAENVPDFTGPIRATRRATVFVAEKAR